MADERLAELLRTQKSLTEWLEDIKHVDVEAIRREDNEKRERLGVLNKTIRLPYDKPTQFQATDLSQRSKKFISYLDKHGDEACALRLIPKVDGLPKLRMRGKPVREAYEWFQEQNLDAAKYRADFIPHPPDYGWATIFVVNKHGMQGEIIWGGHHQLTQGFHDESTPLIFRFDYKKWQIYPANRDALAHLKKLSKFLLVKDARKRRQLKSKLGATFSHDYLEGYFETTSSSLGTWFIDYSPALGKLYGNATFKPVKKTRATKISGQVGHPGKVEGRVRIVDPENIDSEFPEGAILVCSVTTPDYVPLMQLAAAIVTDQGGILSHAAIVARELDTPCIVGTGNATVVLSDGQLVVVDAHNGVVELL